ncbi:uncharacterized protein ACRADG_008383 [Cochliomyia hominivorax]
MLILPKSSLINTKIAQFYKTTTFNDTENVSDYFNSNGTFNTKIIVDYLWPNQNLECILKDLGNYTYEDFLKCYTKLLPIFQHTDSVLNEFNKNFSAELNIKWMGKNVEQYMRIRTSYYKNNENDIFEHILLLTSILANALTNVHLSYQTTGKHAPHLLKDLINSKEIIQVFGLDMVLFLKALMGSPNSINLRNIVWHGFPKPSDIPNYYVSVITITIHTLGSILERKNFKIQERPQIQTFENHIENITKDFEFKFIDLKLIQEQIENLNTDYKEYWLKLLSYYRTEKYKEFIILALTQLELLLRLHFGQVNNFDVTAKLDEYYITMDSIFEPYLINNEGFVSADNKLLDFKNSSFESCFHLLYDLCIAPNGCRLRDKVSHGEVYLEALNNSKLCYIILNIFLCLLFPQDVNLFINYRSKLHLNSVCKVNLKKSYEKLIKFSENKILNDNNLDISVFKQDNIKLSIFKRPKKESILMLLINRISENIYNCVENYEKSIAIRQSLLEQRELHSKRRKTLEKLQNTLPIVVNTLWNILLAISKIYTLLQNDFFQVLEEDIKFNKTLRYLKHNLSIIENFVKYSHYESNEWIKSLELCRKFEEFHKKLFVFENTEIKNKELT